MKESVYVVYDSGVGGLTVMTEIIRQNIQANFIYVGDTINAPYGDKTPEKIMGFVRQNILRLKENYNIRGLIMACNTASILTKKEIEKEFDFPFYSISESIIKDLHEMENLCFLTTQATEKSGFFQELMEKATVRGCEKFVPLIESRNFLFDQYRQDVVKEMMDRINGSQYSGIVLACTHFPFLKKEIDLYFNHTVPVYDPSEQFVRNIKNQIEETVFSLRFVVTGNQETFFEFVKNNLRLKQKNENNEVFEQKKVI